MRKKLLLVYALIFSLLSLGSYAQNIEVKGKVEGPGGKPIDGATVMVKGSNTGTSTNANGEFTINAPRGAILVVSSVDFAPKEIKVEGPSVSVSLSQKVGDLNEVVVTALGLKKEKRALGYSITEVKGAELTEARSVNVANSLVGKVAGLNIASNVTGPGGATRITIRGNTSISRDNQPLIVVDGIPFNNDNLGSVGMWGGADKGDGISSLNPDEIESISVLKGGTAAALYGARASNGAILVTTKGGGKASKGIGVEFNSNYVVEDLLYKKFDDFQYDYGTGDNGLKPTSADPNLNQTNSFGAKLDGSQVIQYDGVSRPYAAVTDNLKKFYNTGGTFTNSIAFYGGSEKIGYRFSASDLNNSGIVPHNTLKRQNFALNLNGNLDKRLSFLLNVKYVREKNRMRPRVSDSPGSANYAVATMPTSLSVETFKQAKYDDEGFEKIWSNNQYVQNPYFATEDYNQHDNKDRFLGVFEPRFNFTNWLYVKGRIGFDRFNYRNVDITPTGTGYQLGGGFSSNQIDFNERNAELLLGVDKDLSNKISLNAIIAGNLMKQVYENDSYSGSPFNIPFFYDISNVSSSSVTTRFNHKEKRVNSVYGSIDLSYNNFLYLNFSGRNDWYSTLGPGSNSLFYPSVGASFILSDALQMPNFINYAKVRASWAQVGGDSDPYKLTLNYALQGATNGAPLAQINQSEVPNANLQPYKLTTYELGLEGRLFNNRFGFDIAVYDRTTTKDIVSATISGASGYTSALFNVGEIKNQGIEVLLSYKAFGSKDFSWEPSFNMAYNKNEVRQLYGDLTKLQVAEPRSRSVYVYQEIGRPFADLQGNAFLRNEKGQVIFDPETGLPQTEQLHKFGSGVSPWTMGLNNSFRYKQISFSFLIDAKYGGFIFSGTNALAARYGLSKITLPGRDVSAVLVPGQPAVNGIVVGDGVTPDGKDNTKQVSAEQYYGNLYNFAEPFVYSSDFIKLRQVILDYTFPSRIFEKTAIRSVSIGLVARNLFTFMKHTPNVDPESNYSTTNAQGFEFVGLPATRTLGVNLNVKF
jgi:TonB-linked SusC/RagA family outer membrane protein